MNNKIEIFSQWYYIKNIDSIDSPALIIYAERVAENINTLKSMIDNVQRLRPQVKTNKTKEATLLMMEAGIKKFKCATIAEAEMLALTNVPDVLLAYQPVGPKLQRFITLIKKYPFTKFSCLTDNLSSAKKIASAAIENEIEIPVYIDINAGMNRTGILPVDNAVELYMACAKTNGIKPVGLHCYDGHIRASDFRQRTIECDNAFNELSLIQKKLIERNFPAPVIIAGGSPTFPIHAKRKDVECSPGTFIYWDKSYQDLYSEQNFVTAALVISRIISLPDETKLCLDLGHKSISTENELHRRVYFLNAPELKFISQGEEHLVVEANAGHSYKIGDVLYGLPFNICATCALYDRVSTTENDEVTEEWKIIARDRKISV